MTQEKTSKTIIRGTAVVGAVTLLSRFLGFVRDLLTAHLFGAGYIADAFFVAFRIPNLLRSFLAEGAMTNAFVPVIATDLVKGHEEARNTIRSVTSLLIIVSTAITLLGIAFSPEIITVFAPGFSDAPQKSNLCSSLLQIMFPFLICISIVAMLNGALNSVHIFGTSAWAQVWMNAVLIIGAVVARFTTDITGAYLLATSVLIGGIVQVIVQIPALRRAHFSIIPSRKILTPSTKQILLLMAPALIGATVYQLQIFMNTVLASLLETGSVSWLFYADRLVQLPIGVFTVALASVLLPSLSKSSAENNHQQFTTNLLNSLRYTSFFIIPIAGLFFILAEPLINIMFERGAFTNYATIKTAQAVKAYSIGIWAVSCVSIVARAFIARKDTVTPTIIGLFTLLITMLLSLAFMGAPTADGSSWFTATIVALQNLLPGTLTHFSLGHSGLALASALASFVSLATLMIRLSRCISISWSPFILASIKSLVATIIAVSLRVLTIDPNQTFIHSSPFLNSLFSIVISSLIFCAAYIVSVFVLRARELTESVSAITKVLSNREIRKNY